MHTISLNMQNGGLTISPEQIIRIEANSNYSKIYCTGGKFPITVAKTLRWFEQQLVHTDESGRTLFVRSHSAHLINRKYIQEVSRGKNQRMLLQNGEVIVISRRRKTDLYRQLSA